MEEYASDSTIKAKIRANNPATPSATDTTLDSEEYSFELFFENFSDSNKPFGYDTTEKMSEKLGENGDIFFYTTELASIVIGLLGIDKTGYLIKFLVRFRLFSRLNLTKLNLGGWNNSILTNFN